MINNPQNLKEKNFAIQGFYYNTEAKSKGYVTELEIDRDQSAYQNQLNKSW